MPFCYTGDAFYDAVLTFALGLAAVVMVLAWLVPSPYGRFASAKLGPSLDPRLGWFLMELPSSVVFAVAFLLGPHRAEPVPLIIAAIWALHYGNRGFFFPLSMRVPRGQKATFGLLVVAFGWLVTTLHGYLYGSFASTHGAHLGTAWLTDPRFLGGLSLYLVCLGLNIHSDAILRRLRTAEEVAQGIHTYRIPRGGLFRWVSSPSYLTELGAWLGLAVATWSLAGVFILVISAANLIPRARSTHRWYRERFPDYPPERRALLPGLW